jgi:3-hydroxybutyryl-CoA dehydrogenase
MIWQYHSGSTVDTQNAGKVAVIGAGTMGPGLAQVFATAGHAVSLFSRSRETLDSALSVVAANLGTFVRHGLVEAEAVPVILARITPSTSVTEAGDGAFLVLETVAERLEAKREVFAELDGSCPEDALITSNTSYLDIFRVVPERRLPRTVIAHWFAPPHIVPLVEVVKGERTSPETVSAVVDLLNGLGRVPVLLERFVPGFCVNRLQRILGREIFYLLDNGFMTAEQLDLAVKASIIPRSMVLGLVQRYDFTGLDLSLRNLQNSTFVEAPLDDSPRSLVDHVERGELGVKSGRGFFDYGGRDLEDVLAERDDALLDVFAAVRRYIDTRI